VDENLARAAGPGWRSFFRRRRGSDVVMDRSRSVGVFLLSLQLIQAAIRADDSRQDVAIMPRNPASVEAGIMAAFRAGRKSVVVPAGVYRIAPAHERWHLEFADLSNFEIDAREATFLWQDRTRGGIHFHRCKNVRLRGAILQHEIVPFTQGTIVALDPGGKSLDVKIDAGYPAELDDPRFFPQQPVGYLFDPATRQWKAGSHDVYGQRGERLGAGLFRIHWGRAQPGEPVAGGNRMAFRGKVVTDVYLDECSGMDLTELTIRNGGGFCVHEDGGEGGSHYRYAVSHGPRPHGATVDPLISCNADAFHSSGVRKGPVLEHCTFEGMCDDGIAIHGSYAQVDHAEGKTLFVGMPSERCFFEPGDPMRLYDALGTLAGESVVREVRKRSDFEPPGPSTHRQFRNRPLHYFALGLDRQLGAGFDFLVSDPGACGAGYVIRDNTIRNHRARGLLLKADRGLVEGNTIDGSTIAGIVLAPELWWNEADYSHDVVIRNNMIRYTGYATSGPASNQAGALTITAEGGPHHEKIRIEDNTFDDIRGVDLQVDHAREILVRDNRFLRTHRLPSRNGKERGIDPEAVIWLSECSKVVMEGNTIAHRGGFGGRLIVATPSAREVKGLTEGVREMAENQP
jgi:hypothetical protein